MTEIVTFTVRSGPCTYCGRPTWMADDDGALHPCCRHWYEKEGRGRCVCGAPKPRSGTQLALLAAVGDHLRWRSGSSTSSYAVCFVSSARFGARMWTATSSSWCFATRSAS